MERGLLGRSLLFPTAPEEPERVHTCRSYQLVPTTDSRLLTAPRGTEYNNVSRSSEIANAIHWLVDQGARVLNHSWTIEEPDSDCMKDKYLEVRNDDDVIAFAAVGNDNDPATATALYPAGVQVG